jgi:hypothetical protein
MHAAEELHAPPPAVTSILPNFHSVLSQRSDFLFAALMCSLVMFVCVRAKEIVICPGYEAVVAFVRNDAPKIAWGKYCTVYMGKLQCSLNRGSSLDVFLGAHDDSFCRDDRMRDPT